MSRSIDVGANLRTFAVIQCSTKNEGAYEEVEWLCRRIRWSWSSP